MGCTERRREDDDDKDEQDGGGSRIDARTRVVIECRSVRERGREWSGEVMRKWEKSDVKREREKVMSREV